LQRLCSQTTVQALVQGGHGLASSPAATPWQGLSQMCPQGSWRRQGWVHAACRSCTVGGAAGPASVERRMHWPQAAAQGWPHGRAAPQGWVHSVGSSCDEAGAAPARDQQAARRGAAGSARRAASAPLPARAACDMPCPHPRGARLRAANLDGVAAARHGHLHLHPAADLLHRRAPAPPEATRVRGIQQAGGAARKAAQLQAPQPALSHL
jgi:hypothetical protein